MDFVQVLEIIMKVVNAQNIEQCIQFVEKLIQLAESLSRQAGQKSS